MKKYYGVCTSAMCNKWGEAPPTFDESQHVLRCSCGAPMYLSIFNPRDAGSPECDKVTLTTIPHLKEP
jgi:hypothetical protein